MGFLEQMLVEWNWDQETHKNMNASRKYDIDRFWYKGKTQMETEVKKQIEEKRVMYYNCYVGFYLQLM